MKAYEADPQSIFIQENCYGSVSEQTALLEKMMPHYFKHEITSAKKIAIDLSLIHI